ncbi:MAG: ATP-grasp domain-containing protein, partial [Actinomycetota bacterium]
GIENLSFTAAANMREGQDAAKSLGFPVVVRPHFSSGGWGSGMAYNLEESPLLLEEAMRESMTGEVLVEEALEGWSKFVVISLRDEQGRFQECGIIEQLESLPKHDQDSLLAYPPVDIGGEEAYGLTEMARETSEALGLVGLAEIKLAVQPGWEKVYVMDVNPWPWRSTSMMEAALGRDLVRMHLELVMGGSLDRGVVEGGKGAGGASVSLPLDPSYDKASGEGYRALRCITPVRRIFAAREAREAAEAALRYVSAAAVGDLWDKDALAALRRLAGREEGPGSRRKDAGVHAAIQKDPPGAVCLSRTTDVDLEECVMLLAGQEGISEGGYENGVSCMQALMAWKKAGGKAVLYTPDVCLAILAISRADAVFVGPLERLPVSEVAVSTGVRKLVADYGGASAGMCLEGLKAAGLEAAGDGGSSKTANKPETMARLKEAGFQVVDFAVSEGIENLQRALEGLRYPLIATVVNGYQRGAQRTAYGSDDVLASMEELRGKRILWREIREEWQEVEVEAVATGSDNHLLLPWEKLDEMGICPSDGLAVYPPCYLTSVQSDMIKELSGEILSTLGWKGNVSLRMILNGGELRLWDIKPGPSADLPFISRASGVPLAEMGMRVLFGQEGEPPSTQSFCSVVRNTAVPYGFIASSEDILPSPQRRSTGSVIGVASRPSVAVAKALWSEGMRPQPGGKAFLSVANREKRRAVQLARELQAAGYTLVATRGTARALRASGVEVGTVNKLREGRPNILDHIRNGEVGLVINIPRGKSPHSDGFYIRAASALHGVPCITNMEVALALSSGLRNADPRLWEVRPLRDYRYSKESVGGISG